MKDEEIAPLEYIDSLFELSRTGKRKRTLNRLADEHLAFFERIARTPAPPPVPIPPKNLATETVYSRQVFLNHIATVEQPLMYTMALQKFLAGLGIRWPDGVFAENPASPGSGRPPSELGRLANKLHSEERLGWSAVAKVLIPEEYGRNKKKARDKVGKLAKRYAAKKRQKA